MKPSDLKNKYFCMKRKIFYFSILVNWLFFNLSFSVFWKKNKKGNITSLYIVLFFLNLILICYKRNKKTVLKELGVFLLYLLCKILFFKKYRHFESYSVILISSTDQPFLFFAVFPFSQKINLVSPYYYNNCYIWYWSEYGI